MGCGKSNGDESISVLAWASLGRGSGGITRANYMVYGEGFSEVIRSIPSRVVALVFGCKHLGRYSWPRGWGEDCYVVCLKCGKHLPYDWERMRRV